MKDGDTSALSLVLVALGAKAAFGALSLAVVTVLQSAPAPLDCVLQPSGSAPPLARSKFSCGGKVATANSSIESIHQPLSDAVPM